MLALSSFLVFLTTFLAAGLAVLIGWFALPSAGLILLMGFSGLCVGMTYPSRDMLVRAVTPPNAYGRVFGSYSKGVTTDTEDLQDTLASASLDPYGNPVSPVTGAPGATLLRLAPPFGDFVSIKGTASAPANHFTFSVRRPFWRRLCQINKSLFQLFETGWP